MYKKKPNNWKKKSFGPIYARPWYGIPYPIPDKPKLFIPGITTPTLDDPCKPPYCGLGTGNGCGCNCSCCPPDPCYKSWTYVYSCGTTSTEWGVPENPGCICPSPALPFIAPSLGIEFPDFDLKNTDFQFNIDDEESGMVYALAGGCSIPCSTVTISVTTTGCCLYGSGTSFTAIGRGTVSATIDNPAVCNGEFSVTINGVENSVAVADCDTVTISIGIPSTECCSCCKISSTGNTASMPFAKSRTAMLRKTSTNKIIITNPSLLRKQILARIKKRN